MDKSLIGITISIVTLALTWAGMQPGGLCQTFAFVCIRSSVKPSEIAGKTEGIVAPAISAIEMVEEEPEEFIGDETTDEELAPEAGEDTEGDAGEIRIAPAVEAPLDLVIQPDAETIAHFYPRRALSRERTGEARLDCTAWPNATMHCTLASESPQHMRFGDAALRLSEVLRVNPEAAVNLPPEGRRVPVTVNFILR